MVLDYTYKSGKFSDQGVCANVIGIRSYNEIGDPEDPFYSDDFKGLLAISIERSAGKDIHLFFENAQDRDKMFRKLAKQMREQLRG